MMSLPTVESEFNRRLETIPRLGLGLSVDVYNPDLFELAGELRRHGLTPGYLELFKAPATALTAVRRHLPDVPLSYHGEGLWVTQPDFPASPSLRTDIADAVAHLQALGSRWLNLECATKQMAGYSFGTYLPPLHTKLSALVVAENVALVQRMIDEGCQGTPCPLVLLEMAPLIYFSAGTEEVHEFFHMITERVSCGLVLDMGHLWTVHRYTAAGHRQGLEEFVADFLDYFPLHRVVEIHVAGLAHHELTPPRQLDEPCPAWIDSHAAAIPSVLWDMFEQTMAHPRLSSLRAVALEVDTKPSPLIVEEFGSAVRRFGEMIRRTLAEDRRPVEGNQLQDNDPPAGSDRDDRNRDALRAQYAQYARVVTGQATPAGLEWQAVLKDGDGLARYVREYLPHEIMTWGGSLLAMFPDTCRALQAHGVALEGFPAWWFRAMPRSDRPYDFFLLKIQRFLEFVAETASDLLGEAEREADMLRSAYDEANGPPRRSHVSEVEA